MSYQDQYSEYDEDNEGSDDYRVKPEDFSDIFVIPSDWTVSVLRQELTDIIDLDPDFQRRSVWTNKAKSKFIESLALGIPIPQILLAETKTSRNHYLVLDGKQRLLTIKEFFDGRLSDGRPFKIEGLTDLKDLNNKDWQQINNQLPSLARSIEAASIRSAIIRGWRNDNVLYEIFHRLNSGSVRLSPMELRMSLIRGPFIKTVIRETSVPSVIHKSLNLDAPDKRMKDVEIVIRHMAFQSRQIAYRGNLKDFLDEYCRIENHNFEEQTVRQRIRELEDAVQVGLTAFADNFSKKYLPERERFETSFNRAVFDVLAGSLIDPKVQDQVRKDPEEFVELFKQVSAQEHFRRSIESTTKSVEATRHRFNAWYDAINRTYGVNLEPPVISDERNKP